MANKLKLTFAISLLIFLFYHSGEISEYWAVIDKVSLWGIVSVAAVVLLDRLLMSYKWLRLLAMRDMHPSLLSTTKIYCSSLIWGLFLPSTIGADSMRIYCMRRMGYKLSELVASVIVERLLGFMAVASAALIGTIYLALGNPDSAFFAEMLRVIVLALLLTLVIFLLSLKQRLFRRALSFVPKVIRRNRFFVKAIDFHKLYVGYKSSNRELVIFYLLSFLEQLLVVFIFWVICKDINLSIGFPQLLGAIMITLLVARIPISLGGIGVFEGALVMILSLYGVDPAASLSVAIIYRVLLILTLLPWFLVNFFQSRHLKMVEPATVKVGKDLARF